MAPTINVGAIASATPSAAAGEVVAARRGIVALDGAEFDAAVVAYQAMPRRDEDDDR